MSEHSQERFDEERLLDVLRHGPAPCVIARWRDRRVVDVNDAFTRLLGWSRDEIIGRTGGELEFVEGAASDELHSHADGLLALRDQQLTVRTKTGELRRVVLTSDLVMLRGERHTVTTFVDSGPCQMPDPSSRLSEARYRALFDASPDGILFGARFDRYLDANPAICQMLGYTREELLRMRATDIVAPADIPRVEEALVSVTSQSVYRGEWELRRKDGSTFPAEVIGALLSDGTVMGLARDATETRRNQSRFRRLVDSNAQGVSFWKADGTITDANDAFLRIVGYSREELRSGAINWITITPADHAAADRRCMEELAHAGVCKPYEKEYTRPDGARVSVLVGAAMLEDGPDEAVSFVVDLTEQKKLEQQFFRAQRMESVGTLAGGIAHDLNNVLAPIMLSSGLLRTELHDSRQLALLETVQSCAQRGADLVQQVLQFARGVEGRVLRINPLHVARDVLRVMRDTFPRSIDIRFNAPAEIWAVEGDPTQMHQVLLNLAVNARDAMPRGGRLTLSVENTVVDETYAAMNFDAKAGRYVAFTLVDTGEGIPDEFRDRIFEPFFTTKEVGKGTGLGLPTSASIVKSHGGFMNVYSDAEQGARFNVYWPAIEVAEDGESADEATEPIELPRGAGELILVIDDEESVRTVARATLERFGYRVMLAANGAEAVATFAVHRKEIAVIITDMAMPIMDGPATIVALQSLDPDVRIIATSGLASEDAIAKAERAGVCHFVPKPYTAYALLQTLRDTLTG